jgi:hypothetical protein
LVLGDLRQVTGPILQRVSEVHPQCLGHLPFGFATRCLVVDLDMLAPPTG